MAEKAEIRQLHIPTQDGGASARVAQPWPGILLFFNDMRTHFFPMEPEGKRLKFNYSLHGCCELMLETGRSFYLGEGQAHIGMENASEGFRFPEGEYRGLELSVDPQCLLPELERLWADIGFRCADWAGTSVGYPGEELKQCCLRVTELLTSGEPSPEMLRFAVLEIIYHLSQKNLLL